MGTNWAKLGQIGPAKSSGAAREHFGSGSSGQKRPKVAHRQSKVDTRTSPLACGFVLAAAAIPQAKSLVEKRAPAWTPRTEWYENRVTTSACAGTDGPSGLGKKNREREGPVDSVPTSIVTVHNHHHNCCVRSLSVRRSRNAQAFRPRPAAQVALLGQRREHLDHGGLEKPKLLLKLVHWTQRPAAWLASPPHGPGRETGTCSPYELRRS